MAGTAADLLLSALQGISVNGTGLLVTVPLAAQSASAATLTTGPDASCPANTDCVEYTLMIPAANPSVGAFSNSGKQSPAAPPSGAVNYTLDGMAFQPGYGGAEQLQSLGFADQQEQQQRAPHGHAGRERDCGHTGIHGMQLVLSCLSGCLSSLP
jgi:hypothetical protein